MNRVICKYSYNSVPCNKVHVPIKVQGSRWLTTISCLILVWWLQLKHQHVYEFVQMNWLFIFVLMWLCWRPGSQQKLKQQRLLLKYYLSQIPLICTKSTHYTRWAHNHSTAKASAALHRLSLGNDVNNVDFSCVLPISLHNDTILLRKM